MLARGKRHLVGSLCARRNDSSTHSYSTVVTIVAAAKCDVNTQFLCEAPFVSIRGFAFDVQWYDKWYSIPQTLVYMIIQKNSIIGVIVW